MKIIIVSTYLSMKDDIKKIEYLYPNDILDVIDSVNMTRPQIVSYINESDSRGVISRGGLFDYLKKRVNKPVIQIDVNTYDLLSLFDMENLKKTVIMGFYEITKYAIKLNEMGHLPIRVITIEKSDEIEIKAKSLEKDDIIYSGYKTFLRLKELGYNTRLIISSIDSIKDSIDNLKAHLALIEEKALKEIVLEAYLGEENQNVYIYKNKELFLSSNINNDIALNDLIEKNKKRLLTNKKVELLFYDRDRMIKLYNYHFKVLNKMYIAIKSNIFNYPYTLKDYHLDVSNDELLSTPVLNEASIYAKGSIPIIICGRDKISIRSISNYIVTKSDYSFSTCFLIDFEAISLKEFNHLIESEMSIFNLKGHCYIITGLSYLDQVNKKRLLNYIINSNILSGNKLIFEDDNPKLIREYLSGIIYYFIYSDNLKESYQYKDTIKRLVNDLKIEISKEIELLIESYPYKNELELKRTILYLKNHTIVDFREILDYMLGFEKKDLKMAESLEENSYQYIKNVLEMNDYNYTKTAKALKIGRTTLWRIIKNNEI